MNYTKEQIEKYLDDILRTSIFRCNAIINNIVITFDTYRFEETTYDKKTILYLYNNYTTIAEMNIENITSII